MFEAEVRRGVVTGFPDVCSALAELRGSFLALVSDLDQHEWQQPSRCHLWCVHDVVRHVRDASKLHLKLLHGEPPPFHPDNPFENREAPLDWLAASAGENPNDTIRDLEHVASAELDALNACVERGGDETYVGPYGRAHWTVLTTHVFWDAWLHRRDIAEPLQRRYQAALREDVAAALYGLLVASIPATVVDVSLDTTVRLTHASGRAFDARVEPGHVTVQPARPGESTDLEGDLGAVVDALAGRGPEVEAVLAGEPTRRQPFTLLRGFMSPSD
jgi:Mycothiol maleylpyruvate isomerase N-terminal domain